MKKLLLSHSLFLIPYFLFAQNIGIGITTPTAKLHVLGTTSNVAIFSAPSSMFITLQEGGNNRGYIGSFAGNPEDIDFGTYSTNTTGKLHLTIQDIPKLTVEASGNIGIGTTDPLSLLHVTNGAILFDGVTGTTPVSGTGTRLMWIPAKAAFRVGKVTGANWDDANIGTNSVAMGNTSTASGFNATAFGSFAVASGDYSTAMGFNALATGYNAVATGGDTRASGVLSTAMGNNTTASGDFSTATGNTTTSKSFGGFVAGTFNDSANAASQVGSNPLNRIFQIGNGTADNARNNAMTVLQNGNTGIGTTTPVQLLDVNGGIRISNTSTALAGSIRFNSGVFEGHDGSSWTSLTQAPGTLVMSTVYPNTSLESNGYYFLSVISNTGISQPINGIPANSWLATATILFNAPAARYLHTAIWTGTEMIIWGGYNGSYLNTGAKYNPATNTWTAISTTNAPSARDRHTVIWTGTDMIVWGGFDAGNIYNTGAKYNPATNTWTAITNTNAPSARGYHTAVWTGSEMIIWGGGDGFSSFTNTGAKYNPVTNTWTTITPTNAPSGRQYHSAIWTGTDMIIWGGNDAGNVFNTGAKYNPSSNTWTTIAAAPTARNIHTAIWTGTDMVVWGGYDGSNTLNSGTKYNPTSNTWTGITNTNAPTARDFQTAVWTGTDMIVWGGYDGSTVLNTGAKYNPSSNAWTAIPNVNTPDARQFHSALWTGTQMIIYGGSTCQICNSAFQTGGRYFPNALPSYNTAIESNGSIYLYSK